MALQATLRAEYDTATAQLAAAEHECTRLTQDLAVAQGRALLDRSRQMARAGCLIETK
jgi:hypothetical protein